jgi:hypothetical protein
MPITSVDIPKEIMEYVHSLVEKGKVSTFKDLAVELLRFHKKFSMSEWADNIVYFYGLRHAFISERSLKVIVQEMDYEKQYEIGKKMGKTWLDAFFARYGCSISKEKWDKALNLIEESGWGNFNLNGKTIVVKRPFLPLPMLQGYLESGLNIKLKRLPTTEQIGVFEIVES